MTTWYWRPLVAMAIVATAVVSVGSEVSARQRVVARAAEAAAASAVADMSARFDRAATAAGAAVHAHDSALEAARAAVASTEGRVLPDDEPARERLAAIVVLAHVEMARDLMDAVAMRNAAMRTPRIVRAIADPVERAYAAARSVPASLDPVSPWLLAQVAAVPEEAAEIVGRWDAEQARLKAEAERRAREAAERAARAARQQADAAARDARSPSPPTAATGSPAPLAAPRIDRTAEIAALVRSLSGRTVTVVLGGGGISAVVREGGTLTISQAAVDAWPRSDVRALVAHEAAHLYAWARCDLAGLDGEQVAQAIAGYAWGFDVGVLVYGWPPRAVYDALSAQGCV
ncbi:hypothetical protein [Microbacterium sp. HJ5]